MFESCEEYDIIENNYVKRNGEKIYFNIDDKKSNLTFGAIIYAIEFHNDSNKFIVRQSYYDRNKDLIRMIRIDENKIVMFNHIVDSPCNILVNGEMEANKDSKGHSYPTYKSFINTPW